MKTPTCPQCKREISDGNLTSCPACGWSLASEIAPTVIAKADPNAPTIPPIVPPIKPQSASIETTPTLEAQTLQPPGQPKLPGDANLLEPTLVVSPDFLDDESGLTAKEQAATVDLSSDAEDDQPQTSQSDDGDPALMNTLPSANKPRTNKPPRTSNDGDKDATMLTTGAGEKPPTVQGSIDSVIPPRSISRTSEPGKLQDYQVGKRIGAGSFGVVYRALQVPLDRSVALKVLTSESSNATHQERLQNEFLREAQFTGKLEHPNIVPIHDIGLTHDKHGKMNRPFYVMKEIHGDSWLKKMAELSRAENIEIFKKVVDAIGFAHARNVLHCDLKPENVMLGEFGEVLVVDWGQAIDLSRPETIRPGGTPAYISPEMAGYWCDIYLDKLPESKYRSEIGPASDVYLLGGILLEMITGKIPRSAAEDESQYDVIRRACDNELDVVDKPDDELVRIAERALRVSNAPPIATIEELQSEIRAFETRALSIELRQRADNLLQQAKTEASYDLFQKAKFGYEESIQNWPQNATAVSGLCDTRLSCARLALEDQNFDLGIDVIGKAETPEEKQALKELVDGKRARDRRQTLVRFLAFALVASIVLGVLMNWYMINKNLKSIEVRDQALAEKDQIEFEKQEIETEKQLLASQVGDSRRRLQQQEAQFREQEQAFSERLNAAEQEFESQLATQRRKYNEEKMKLAAEKAITEADLTAARQEFASEKQKFDLQRDGMSSTISNLNSEISELNTSSTLLRVKTLVSTIQQTLRAGDFREARRLLDSAPNKGMLAWARLNLLAHREIQSFYPVDRVKRIVASEDGGLIGLLFDDRIEIRQEQDVRNVSWVYPCSGVESLAISGRRKWLVIGIPSTHPNEAGTIRIIEFSDPGQFRTVGTLAAQSLSINDLNFNAQGDLLLAVGKPSRLRRSSSSQGEKELMVWKATGERLEVNLTMSNGGQPKFSRAIFSNDGTRILLMNPTGLGIEQSLHLLTGNADGYSWLAQSPKTNVNVGTFVDDAGTEIAACYRDPANADHSLIAWRPNSVLQSSEVSFDASSDPNDGFRSIAAIDHKIVSIGRLGDWLVCGDENRKSTIWNWRTKMDRQFKGHSKTVDFCSLANARQDSELILVSGSAGTQAELLRTKVAQYRREVVERKLAERPLFDNASPSCLFQSELSKVTIIGNNQGLVTVLPAPEDDLGSHVKPIRWEVSAWKQHILSDDYLFAQSRRDDFYQYDRRTGNLERVLTRISKLPRDGNVANSTSVKIEIEQFIVSQNGKTALITTTSGKPEFEIWDLEKQERIRTVDYGAEKVFGIPSNKRLSRFAISRDGSWVAAGKAGLFVWSTETGERRVLAENDTKLPRTSIDNICFTKDSSKLVVSWRGRIELFELQSGDRIQSVSLPQLVANKNETGLLDCCETTGRLLTLIQVQNESFGSEIALFDLKTKIEIRRFPSANFASFSDDLGSVLTIENRQDQRRLVRYDMTTGNSEDIEMPAAFRERFSNLQRLREYEDGQIILQSTTRNSINPIRPDWNSLSIGNGRQIGNLRVFAKPEINACFVAGQVACTLDSGLLRFWQFSESGVVPDGLIDIGCRLCRLSPDQMRMLLVPDDNSPDLLLLDFASRETVARLAVDPQSVASIGWSADSRRFALGRKSGIVEIWELSADGKSARQRSVLESAPTPVTKIAFSKDGSTVMAVHANSGLARVYKSAELDQFQVVQVSHNDGSPIVTGDIADDGNRLVTGSTNGRITIWNTRLIDKLGDDLSSSLERRLFDLASKHDSPIRFLEILETSGGQPTIASAEQDSQEGQFLLWNLQRDTNQSWFQD